MLGSVSANSQVLLLLIVVSVLVFLSSLVSIDFHTIYDQLAHNQRLSRASFQKNYVINKVKFKPSGIHPNEILEINDTIESVVEIATRQCKLTFLPKCPMNPLVMFWDETTECYVSPLKKYSGLHLPAVEQKFVVFQSDLGGWNNIRMALEVVFLFAKVTGRILVLPPNAVLYLLNMNKKWGDNKSGMEDYFDFSRLRAGDGLETMPMKEFLETIAKPGLLKLPLPENNTDLIRKPLYDYLEQACYVRPWSPGKIFLGFNISTTPGRYSDLPHSSAGADVDPQRRYEEQVRHVIGLVNHSDADFARLDEFSLKHVREVVAYDLEMHAQRAIFFPGHKENRLLTHFYSFLFFTDVVEDHRAKRFIRDRLRYHDQIFCTASILVDKLLMLDIVHHSPDIISRRKAIRTISQQNANKILEEVAGRGMSSQDATDETSDADMEIVLEALQEQRNLGTYQPQYVAFHIRRGDFQQKHTRLPAEKIVELIRPLVPDRSDRFAYISTDESKRTFFEPFFAEFKAVYFLSDLKNGTDVDSINQNYVGMIEQVVCASAHTFIGTPLSTFTAYITRMRGYMNRTIDSAHTVPVVVPRSDLRIPPGSEVVAADGASPSRIPASPINRAGLYNRTPAAHEATCSLPVVDTRFY